MTQRFHPECVPQFLDTMQDNPTATIKWYDLQSEYSIVLVIYVHDCSIS